MSKTFNGFGLALAVLLFQQVSCQTCYFKNLNKTSDLIESHSGAGTTNYTNNMRCYWQITAPVDSRINVWFVFLEIERGNDKVTFFDGVNNSAILATIDYSYTQPMMPTYTSTSNILTILFSTSGSVTMRGFKLFYEFTKSPASTDCGAVSFPTSLGLIGMLKSHPSHGNTPYPANADCSWLLPAQPGKYITLSLIMTLAAGDCLKLTSRDLDGTNFMGFCGWTARNNVTMRANTSVVIEFTTDGKFESRGFLLSFTYNDSSTSNHTSTSTWVICGIRVPLTPVLLPIVIVVPLLLIAVGVSVGCLICKRRQNRLKRSASNPPSNVWPEKSNPAQLEFKTNPLDYPPPYGVSEKM